MMARALDLFDYDVAIAGAGPVGATLAALLGQAGISVFIGDGSHDIYPMPRAAHFDHEIMRIFQQLGIAETIASSIVVCDHYIFQNGAGDVLFEFVLDKPADTGWHNYMIHQPGIERALRARLDSSPCVEFRTGVAFKSAVRQDNGVETVWQDSHGTFAITARYLVGCDGAGSLVREALGSGLDDLQFDEPWLVLDLVVDADNGLPRITSQYCDPRRPTTYGVMGDNRRRFEFMLKPGETPDDMLRDEVIDRLLEPWNTHGIRSVERKAVYRFHALVAEHWRDGRIFIAGDAAHQMPPFAGQGMCSGIRDAVALAWRLPLALRSSDSHHLLETYQAEREPHVRAITAAAIIAGQVVCTLDPAIAAERDAAMLAAKAAGAPIPDISSPPLNIKFGLPDTPHAGQRFFQPVVTRNGSPLRMDDVLGPGAWLIARTGQADQPLDPLTGVRLVSLDDPALAPFRDELDTWLATAESNAVLVRADRYVFGTGEPAALLGAYAAQAGLTAA